MNSSRQKPEDSADGCRAMAASDRARAQATENHHMRARLEHSSKVWTERSDLLARLEASFLARTAATVAEQHRPAGVETGTDQSADAIEQRSANTGEASNEEEKADERVDPFNEASRNMQQMKIEGSIRSNLISAINSARRWRGRPVHQDTISHWRGVLEHGRRAGTGPLGEPVAELVAQLESELAVARVR